MKITVELNEDDICRLISEHYRPLPPDRVELKVSKEIRGYGPTEHEENVIYAKIDFDSETMVRECFTSRTSP